MKEFTIVINGRTPKWYWQMKWCKDHGRHPSQQPIWFKAHYAWIKSNLKK